jgi:uncharacterized Zn finger protein (UPF0148 family)
MKLNRCDECGSEVKYTADGMFCPVHGEVKILIVDKITPVAGVERQNLHVAEEGSLP